MKNRCFFALAMVLLSIPLLRAQQLFCGMYEVTTQEKITQGTHIFKGEVVAAESF